MHSDKLTDEQRSGITLTNILEKDCAVIALQAITGWSRRRAHREASAAGYGDDHGAPRGTLEKALRTNGYTCTPVLYEDHSAATFALTKDYGTFLVYVEAHVMGLIDGDLHNSRGYWHDRVQEATQVTANTVAAGLGHPL